jgi:hypothetical protein
MSIEHEIQTKGRAKTMTPENKAKLSAVLSKDTVTMPTAINKGSEGKLEGTNWRINFGWKPDI